MSKCSCEVCNCKKEIVVDIKTKDGIDTLVFEKPVSVLEAFHQHRTKFWATDGHTIDDMQEKFKEFKTIFTFNDEEIGLYDVIDSDGVLMAKSDTFSIVEAILDNMMRDEIDEGNFISVTIPSSDHNNTFHFDADSTVKIINVFQADIKEDTGIEMTEEELLEEFKSVNAKPLFNDKEVDFEDVISEDGELILKITSESLAKKIVDLFL